jgi:hypothetical protein
MGTGLPFVDFNKVEFTVNLPAEGNPLFYIEFPAKSERRLLIFPSGLPALGITARKSRKSAFFQFLVKPPFGPNFP